MTKASLQAGLVCFSASLSTRQGLLLLKVPSYPPHNLPLMQAVSQAPGAGIAQVNKGKQSSVCCIPTKANNAAISQGRELGPRSLPSNPLPFTHQRDLTSPALHFSSPGLLSLLCKWEGKLRGNLGNTESYEWGREGTGRPEWGVGGRESLRINAWGLP